MRQDIIHPKELTFEDGAFLVKLARKTVEEYIKNNGNIEIKPPQNTPKHLLRPGMCFTTIETFYTHEKRSLRGCIGFLIPVYSLVEAVMCSAIEAAFNDPRFHPLEETELDTVTFEVSILSEPKPLTGNRLEYPRKIIIGRHGLVVKKIIYQGTLLPQVPVEYCWDEETFLAETCIKAGLEPDCWLDDNTQVLIYEGRVFREKEPRGEIEERDLHEEYKILCRRP